MEFFQGQRVKLTIRAALMKQHGIIKQKHSGRRDWLKREGTVAHRTMPGSGSVLVTWDGMKAPDSWPKTAIELIDERAG